MKHIVSKAIVVNSQYKIQNIYLRCTKDYVVQNIKIINIKWYKNNKICIHPYTKILIHKKITRIMHSGITFTHITFTFSFTILYVRFVHVSLTAVQVYI